MSTPPPSRPPSLGNAIRAVSAMAIFLSENEEDSPNDNLPRGTNPFNSSHSSDLNKKTKIDTMTEVIQNRFFSMFQLPLMVKCFAEPESYKMNSTTPNLADLKEVLICLNKDELSNKWTTTSQLIPFDVKMEIIYIYLWATFMPLTEIHRKNLLPQLISCVQFLLDQITKEVNKGDFLPKISNIHQLCSQLVCHEVLGSYEYHGYILSYTMSAYPLIERCLKNYTNYIPLAIEVLYYVCEAEEYQKTGRCLLESMDKHIPDFFSQSTKVLVYLFEKTTTFSAKAFNHLYKQSKKEESKTCPMNTSSSETSHTPQYSPFLVKRCKQWISFMTWICARNKVGDVPSTWFETCVEPHFDVIQRIITFPPDLFSFAFDRQITPFLSGVAMHAERIQLKKNDTTQLHDDDRDVFMKRDCVRLVLLWYKQPNFYLALSRWIDQLVVNTQSYKKTRCKFSKKNQLQSLKEQTNMIMGWVLYMIKPDILYFCTHYTEWFTQITKNSSTQIPFKLLQLEETFQYVYAHAVNVHVRCLYDYVVRLLLNYPIDLLPPLPYVYKNTPVSMNWFLFSIYQMQTDLEINHLEFQNPIQTRKYCTREHDYLFLKLFMHFCRSSQTSCNYLTHELTQMIIPRRLYTSDTKCSDINLIQLCQKNAFYSDFPFNQKSGEWILKALQCKNNNICLYTEENPECVELKKALKLACVPPLIERRAQAPSGSEEEKKLDLYLRYSTGHVEDFMDYLRSQRPHSSPRYTRGRGVNPRFRFFGVEDYSSLYPNIMRDNNLSPPMSVHEDQEEENNQEDENLMEDELELDLPELLPNMSSSTFSDGKEREEKKSNTDGCENRTYLEIRDEMILRGRPILNASQSIRPIQLIDDLLDRAQMRNSTMMNLWQGNQIRTMSQVLQRVQERRDEREPMNYHFNNPQPSNSSSSPSTTNSTSLSQNHPEEEEYSAARVMDEID